MPPHFNVLASPDLGLLSLAYISIRLQPGRCRSLERSVGLLAITQAISLISIQYLQSWLIDKLLVGSIGTLGNKRLMHQQVSPLPHVVTSVLRKLPIPQLQDIVTADERLTGYIKDLYENGDEKSPEGRWSMLVRIVTEQP